MLAGMTEATRRNMLCSLVHLRLGFSRLSCVPQARGMPGCWLVLLRFWLRVDGVLVRLREARYFCDLAGAPDTVLREVKHSEGSFADLRAHGAPADGVRSLLA